MRGRGSSDCKNNLIGLMSVLEEVISQRLQPRRTVVLAFGFDEETGGARGAAEIAKVLESEWGRDGFSIVLDEGGMNNSVLESDEEHLSLFAYTRRHEVRHTYY